MFLRLTGWKPYDTSVTSAIGPKLLKAKLTLNQTPADTYFDFDCQEGCQDWLHGAVFVNGFNIGRYFQVGPQKTLYIPGDFLKQGENEVRSFMSRAGLIFSFVT